MAQGASWIGIASAPKVNMQVEYAILESGVAGTSTGVWFDASDTIALGVIVSGLTTGTIQIHGSNAATIPANASAGIQIKTAITANGVFTLDRHEIPKWVKVMVQAHSSGTVVIAAKRWRQGIS